jgi:hypothetical protein
MPIPRDTTIAGNEHELGVFPVSIQLPAYRQPAVEVRATQNV